MDTKNIIAAISLSLAIIVMWSLFFQPSPEEIKKRKEKEKIVNETKRQIAQQNKEDFKQVSKMIDETYYKEKNKQNDDYEVPEFLKKQEEQLKKWKVN